LGRIKYNLPVIVDFHTHIFPAKVRDNRAEYLRDPAFAALYSGPKAAIATDEDLIASMDRDGIDASVALGFGWRSHELCVETNDYVLEAAGRYPGRIIPFCAVQPLAQEAALREIERCLEGGARGIGELRADEQSFSLDDERVMAPLAELARLSGLPLLLHTSEPVGHTYAGKGTATPEVLYRFISCFPEVKLILAHWGGGLAFYALMPEVADALKNTYFDTAASPLLYRWDILAHVSRIVGEDKVLFGSDYPLLKPARLIRAIKGIGLLGQHLNHVLGGNAQRILGLGAETRAAAPPLERL